MGLRIDPDGVETRAIHSLINFRGKDVVEIGCGDGRMTWRFAEHAKSVTALDPDAAMIESARERLPGELRSRVSFRVADIGAIDLQEDGYDIAVFSGSL